MFLGFRKCTVSVKRRKLHFKGAKHGKLRVSTLIKNIWKNALHCKGPISEAKFLAEHTVVPDQAPRGLESPKLI